MEKQYIPMELECIGFGNNDVISTSGLPGDMDGDIEMPELPINFTDPYTKTSD